MFSLLLIAASILPTPKDVLRDACDLIEVNQFYDEHGRLVFDQVIFYDWCENVTITTNPSAPSQWTYGRWLSDPDSFKPKTYKDSRYNVVDWRLVKSPNMLPERDFARGGYACVWVDGEVARSVRAGEYRETWTQFDPELAEREILPKERRRHLKGER